MKYNPLGRTGIDVSEICLGTMTWGTQNSEAEAHEQMDYAVEQGVNFFDTAEMYPTTPVSPERFGRTEEYIGTWLEKPGNREKVIVATKVLGNGRFPSPHGDDINAKKVRRACEDSLKRLRTDYIDLYQLHWPNRGSYHFRQTWGFSPEHQDTAKAKDDIADTLRGLADLVKEGKIRHIGLSNESVWGLAQYLKIAEAEGLPRIASIQNEYSLLHRIYDTDMAEACHHEDVAMLPYSPLACGLLTGKYQNGAVPEGSRGSIHRDLGGRLSDYVEPALSKYLALAEKYGVDPTQMALAFCFQRPLITSTIIGATTMEQLKTCIGAKDVTLSDALLAEIEDVYHAHPIPM